MKKRRSLSFFMILILVVGFFILNIEVTTRQGIDYKVYTLKVPLYLKILDFYDRHFNYKWLVHKIINGKATEEEKVMAIFNWTIENIADQPKELPVVDDHVWHIIIRGYGAHDQFSDVFTTLCNYAGFDAFFAKIYTKDKTSKISFSFVKINNRWHVFHPYNGAYFINKDGKFASVEDLANGNWSVKQIGNLQKKNFIYQDYFNEEITKIDFNKFHRFSRANIQSPINRFFYGVFKRHFTEGNVDID